MTSRESKETPGKEKSAHPEGLLSAIKIARPIIITAAIFYLLGGVSVLVNTEQVALEAIGLEYTDSDLTTIRLAGILLTIAGLLFAYSIKLIRTASTLKELRTGSVIVLISAIVTIGGSQNIFSLLLLLAIIVPVFIIGTQAHKLLRLDTE